MDHSKERHIEITLLTLTADGFIRRKINAIAKSFTTLLDFLRNELDLTGAKEACGVGECGACTVIMNGVAVRACLVLAFEADGAEILTVEGLTHNNQLHPLQKSFIEHDAVQCGYCTPGLLMAAYNLYQRIDKPSKEEIIEAMSGHLCRCTGYQSIFKAIANVGDRKGKE